MKKWKRMLAVLLTVIMTLAMTTTVFAAQQTPPKGSLKVSVNEGNTLENQTIKLYKLFDLEASENQYIYTVNESYKNAIATALGVEDLDTSEKLYTEILNLRGAAVQKFAHEFTVAILTAQPGVTETKSSGKIDTAAKNYTFTDLDYGYYLVYQTGTSKLQSSLVSIYGETAEVELKGEAPNITKTADKETVEIGQVVTYTITGTIPDTTGYNSYVYKIKDTLSNGLDFVTNEDGTALDKEAETLAVSVQIAGEMAVQKWATLGKTNKREMTLDLSQWIIDNQASKGKEFTVTYYAKVNESAVVTEKNSAALEYGNDPDNATTTTPVEVKTPTYPLQIHKLIKDRKSSYLAGAIFRLYRVENDANLDQEAIAVTGSNGNYTVDPVETGDGKQYDMVSIGNGTDVGAGMNLKLNGLAAGTYWLREIKAPDGYHGVTTSIKITIEKSTDDTNVTGWTIRKNDVTDTDQIIDIENSAGTILPGTGGMGTVLFTVVGVALILIVAASFISSRKKRRR